MKSQRQQGDEQDTGTPAATEVLQDEMRPQDEFHTSYGFDRPDPDTRGREGEGQNSGRGTSGPEDLIARDAIEAARRDATDHSDSSRGKAEQ